MGEISISIIKDNLEPNGPSNEPSKTVPRAHSRTSDDDGTKERGTLTSRKKVIMLEAKSDESTVDKRRKSETPRCPVAGSDENATELSGRKLADLII